MENLFSGSPYSGGNSLALEIIGLNASILKCLDQ
jgi:hypothetical protein